MIRLPRDADLLDDLRAIRVLRGVAQVPEARRRGGDGKRRHADAAVAVALAHAAGRMDVPPMEFEALGRERVAARLDDFLGGAGRSGFADYLGG